MDQGFSVKLNDIGLCLISQNKYDEALEYLMQSMQIQAKISKNLDTDLNFSSVLFNIGHFLFVNTMTH